ncbi:VanZ family protein [uncultured Microbacterium sp.]|uniref:VanZ family protein n=1 Tax=uncultured Microbacterium sp. TaxID=191216 RepID=UPI0025F3448D|nr:VanZ family protein [uncultured Microbacterium sp.]
MPADRPPLRRRYVMTSVAVFYLVALGVILLWPDHLDRHADGAYAILYALFPGATSGTLDFGLNVVLFLPFGVLLATLLRGHPWRLLGIAWVVPLLVEIFQGVFLPGRTSSAVDVVANTLGGVIGAVSTVVVRRYLTRRRTRGRR